VSWYNRAVDDAFRLQDFGKPSALGILIGNTRAIWPRFLETLRANRPRLDARHPLESYIEATVLTALEAITHRSEVRWAQDPPPRRVAMQRLAHLSGLAYLSPSHLNVHATYGPWIALRAAVVIDVDGPSGPPREPSNPCPDCESHCLPRFREAIAATGAASAGHAAIERHWPLWLAVRDACPVGLSHRYSDSQIRYHYTKEPEVLRRVHGSSDHERPIPARDLAPACARGCAHALHHGRRSGAPPPTGSERTHADLAGYTREAYTVRGNLTIQLQQPRPRHPLEHSVSTAAIDANVNPASKPDDMRGRPKTLYNGKRFRARAWHAKIVCRSVPTTDYKHCIE